MAARELHRLGVDAVLVAAEASSPTRTSWSRPEPRCERRNWPWASVVVLPSATPACESTLMPTPASGLPWASSTSPARAVTPAGAQRLGSPPITGGPDGFGSVTVTDGPLAVPPGVVT